MTTRPLTLDDIADQRAYERERDAFRRDVIAHKKVRRVTVGPVITLTFESRMTMRFQVQEMARAERMTTDEQIQHELDVYNRLLPVPGELSATLFLELTTEDDLRTWLPRLVGIERSVVLEIGEGPQLRIVRSVPDQEHESQLTARRGHLGGPLRPIPVHPGRGGGLRHGPGQPGRRPPGLPRRAPRCRAVGRHPCRAVPGPGRAVARTGGRRATRR